MAHQIFGPPVVIVIRAGANPLDRGVGVCIPKSCSTFFRTFPAWNKKEPAYRGNCAGRSNTNEIGGAGRLTVNKIALIFTNMSKNSKQNFALAGQISGAI
jgi:hypothetical protein